MEIVVATAIFAGTVTLMLDLFTSALRINRRVQGLRQVAQGTRNFTDTLTREIRNGRVDYNSFNNNCLSNNYSSTANQGLGLINFAGEEICFYYVNTTQQPQQLILSKRVGSSIIQETINPSNFRIKPDTFRFIVRPTRDPAAAPYDGIQPMVTIFAEFEVTINSKEPPVLIPYQTTISTDVYDIPHQQ